MQKAAVIIPNLNGETYIRACLDSLRRQERKDFTVIVVDNGSTDESPRVIREEYTEVILIELDRNYGFCRAVNEGIRASHTEYVILLNNDTQAAPGFVGKLLEAMEGREQIFSCQARMRKRWMMQEIIIVHLDGPLQWEKGNRPKSTADPGRSFLPAEEPVFTGERCLIRSDGSMNVILRIWKMWIWGLGQGSPDMKTGTHRRRRSFIREALPPVPDIILLKYIMQPAITCI